MNKLRILRFNLIEIALAMAVLAIGISSLMVLFPVGLNASNRAVAENNISDAIERLSAEIKGRLGADTNWEGSTFLNAFGNTKPESNEEENWLSQFTESDGTPRDVVFFNSGSFWFLKKRPGSDLVDFSAEALIWKESTRKVLAMGVNGQLAGDREFTDNKNTVRLLVELSWPLEMPYQLRKNAGNYRIFTFELTNPNNSPATL